MKALCSTVLAILLAIVGSLLVGSTVVNNGKEIWCARAKVFEVRISNCEAEPCTVKKDVSHPFEVDFQFDVPASSSKVDLSVFISYWAKPPAFYGSNIGGGYTCSDLKLTCPVKAGIRYTMKSQIKIHPQSQDTLTNATTGERSTNWSLGVRGDSNNYSVCNFDVKLNIVQ